MTELAALTAAEADLLADAEAVIERGIKTFIEVGEALASVRDNRLYRADFSNFEDYCRERWGFSRQRALQLIDASEVATTIVVNGLPAPANEAQARELAPLLSTPGEMRAAFEDAIQRADGKPTAAVIREVVRERMDPASPLARAAERELDKVEQRAEIRAANAPLYEPLPPETQAYVDDLGQRIGPVVSIQQGCEFLLDSVRGIDPEAAVAGAPDKLRHRLDVARTALDFLTRVVDAMQPKEVSA